MGSAKALNARGIFAAALIAAVVLLALPVYASQPALPTVISGRVTYANNTPAQGLAVEATWKDNDGQLHTSTTKTLTLKEATEPGTPELAGYYFFNDGYVQAQEGSDIVIKAPGSVNEQKVMSAPGKGVVAVPPLLLPDTTDKTPPGISGVTALNTESGAGISFSTSEIATSAVKYGIKAPVSTAANNTLTASQLIAVTGLAPYSSYLFEVTATDISGNIATDNNNGQYYRINTGAASGGSSGAGQGTAGTAGAGASKPTPNKPGSKTQPGIPLSSQPAEAAEGNPDDFEATPNTLPTSIYGKLTDDSGKPVEKAQVTAEWKDGEGNTHSIKAETLNERDAKKLGNPELAGYYFFRQNLSLPYGKEVNITSPDVKGYQATAKANPGGSSQAVVIVKKGTGKAVQSAGRQPQKTVQASAQENDLKAGNSTRLSEIPGNKAQTAAKLGILLAAAAAALFTASSFRRYAKARKKAAEKSGLGKIIKKATGKMAKSIMTKDVLSITCGETIRKAIQLMLEKQKAALLVMDGESCMGWSSEQTTSEDCLLNLTGLDKPLKTATLAKPVKVSPDATLPEIQKQLEKSKARKALVVYGQKVLGVVTVHDIAKALKEFNDVNAMESQSLPDAASAMHGALEISKDDTLGQARQAMKNSETDYALVRVVKAGMAGSSQAGQAGQAGREEEQNSVQKAIITTRDIIEEISVNPNRASKARALSIAKSPLLGVEQYKSLFEINNTMLKEKLRRLPVISRGEVVGIVTQEDVVKGLLDYLTQIGSAVGSGQLKIKKL